jgi:hypothetical protein
VISVTWQSPSSYRIIQLPFRVEFTRWKSLGSNPIAPTIVLCDLPALHEGVWYDTVEVKG